MGYNRGSVSHCRIVSVSTGVTPWVFEGVLLEGQSRGHTSQYKAVLPVGAVPGVTDGNIVWVSAEIAPFSVEGALRGQRKGHLCIIKAVLRAGTVY